MSGSDPIADMLLRIRNAQQAERDVVEMPHSKVKSELARIFKKEGFIADFGAEGGMPKTLRIILKYAANRQPAIRGLQRVSKSGLRVYKAADELPRVLGGMGVAVISTSAGLMTDREARKRGIGGEVLCRIW